MPRTAGFHIILADLAVQYEGLRVGRRGLCYPQTISINGEWRFCRPRWPMIILWC